MFLRQHCNSWSNVWRNCLQVFTSFCKKKPDQSSLPNANHVFGGCFVSGDEPMDWCKQNKRNVAQGHCLLEDELVIPMGTLRVGQFVSAAKCVPLHWSPDDMATRCGFPCISPRYFLGFPPKSHKQRLYYIQSGKLTWQKSMKMFFKKGTPWKIAIYSYRLCAMLQHFSSCCVKWLWLKIIKPKSNGWNITCPGN